MLHYNPHIKSIAVCPILLFLDLDVLDTEAGGVHQVQYDGALLLRQVDHLKMRQLSIYENVICFSAHIN